MRPIRSLLIYCAFIFLGGAILAPWLYQLAQIGAAHFPSMEKIAHNPFHRFVNRALLFLAIAGLWPFFRSLKLRWRDFGLYGAPRHETANFGRGFALGFISLALVAIIAFVAGAREITSHSNAEIARMLWRSVLTALFVAILEESIFRGGIFGGLRQLHSWKRALIISSAVFALMHFFGKPAQPQTVQWSSGFFTLGQMLKGFAAFEAFVPGFFNLFLAGAILTIAFQKTGTLYFSIGLHAGWIFWVKSHGFFTHAAPGASLWIWGSNKLIDGWLALVILAAVLALVHWMPQKAQEARGETTNLDESAVQKHF
jgi:uncharacterized protein